MPAALVEVKMKPIGKATPIVFVVDDDSSVREAVSSLLRSAGLRVEVFASAMDFFFQSRPLGPACLVLDVGLPGLSGIDLQQQLSKAERPLPIIFITAQGDIPTTVRAMKAGALEFLTKPFSNEDLLAAVHDAIACDRQMLAIHAQHMGLRGRYETLTPREREVMALVITGMMNKEVAGRLGISAITVKTHRGRVMRKMQASSLADLVRMAERLERET